MRPPTEWRCWYSPAAILPCLPLTALPALTPQYLGLMEQQENYATAELRYGLGRIFRCLNGLSRGLQYLNEVGTQEAYNCLQQLHADLAQSRSQDQYLTETPVCVRLPRRSGSWTGIASSG